MEEGIAQEKRNTSPCTSTITSIMAERELIPNTLKRLNLEEKEDTAIHNWRKEGTPCQKESPLHLPPPLFRTDENHALLERIPFFLPISASLLRMGSQTSADSFADLLQGRK
jgi:hypothetical protein